MKKESGFKYSHVKQMMSRGIVGIDAHGREEGSLGVQILFNFKVNSFVFFICKSKMKRGLEKSRYSETISCIFKLYNNVVFLFVFFLTGR